MWCWKDEAAFDDDNRIFANARFSNPIRPVPILSIHFCKLHYAKRGACWSLLLPFRPPLLTVQYSTPSRRILPDALRDLDCLPCSPAENGRCFDQAMHPQLYLRKPFRILDDRRLPSVYDPLSAHV